jgi:hypothetical protein
LEPSRAGHEILVQLFGMNGEIIASATFKDKQIHDFTLAGKPAGIYLIRVIDGKQTGAVRIVKQ